MEKAQHKSQPVLWFNLRRKQNFEFVTDFPLKECVARMGGKNNREVEWCIPQSNLILTVKPVKPGQIFEFSIRSGPRQNISVRGSGYIEKLNADQTRVYGESELNPVTALTLTLGTLSHGMLAGWLLLDFQPLGLMPLPLLFVLWRITLNGRSRIIEFVTGVLFFEKPKHQPDEDNISNPGRHKERREENS